MSSWELAPPQRLQRVVVDDALRRHVPPAFAARPQYPTRITVRVDERILFVRTDDVEFFEGSRNYAKIHVGSQVYRIRMSLRELTARLDPSRFRRIHRSVIVNLDHVREVQPWFGGDYVALLRDRRQLRVSRTFAQQLLRTLQ